MSPTASINKFGMWVFLGTETLFFGALFTVLYIHFYLTPVDFNLALQHMDLALGSVNTLVLLTSSWTMAMALFYAQKSQKKRAVFLMTLTVLLGFLFMVLKISEYIEHGRDHLIPALDWHPVPAMPKAAVLFFFMYFVMTLLHALHLTIGMGLISFYGWRFSKDQNPAARLPLLENLGLYWHFVDLVWIFLFPSLYLIGRS